MNWTKPVESAIEGLLAKEAAHKIAVFDADGTLWHDDIGDGFFKWQIKNNLAPGLKGVSDPWNHYKAMCKEDPFKGYSWLSQINSGVKEEDLIEQSHTFYKAQFRSKINPTVRKLIKDLKENKFDVWICTASIKWALYPALKDLGIDTQFLIGMEVKVDSEKRLTKDLVHPLPYKSGKKLALEKKLPTKPMLVAGNSMGDFDMLGLATVLPLVIIYKPHLPEIKESELSLLEAAANKKWPIQIFQQ